MTALYPDAPPSTDLAEPEEADAAAPRQRPSEIRGADYRQKAQDAADSAAASPLENVRHKHEAAAARWLELAGLEDQRTPAAGAPGVRIAFSASKFS